MSIDRPSYNSGVESGIIEFREGNSPLFFALRKKFAAGVVAALGLTACGGDDVLVVNTKPTVSDAGVITPDAQAQFNNEVPSCGNEIDPIVRDHLYPPEQTIGSMWVIPSPEAIRCYNNNMQQCLLLGDECMAIELFNGNKDNRNSYIYDVAASPYSCYGNVVSINRECSATIGGICNGEIPITLRVETFGRGVGDVHNPWDANEITADEKPAVRLFFHDLTQNPGTRFNVTANAYYYENETEFADCPSYKWEGLNNLELNGGKIVIPSPLHTRSGFFVKVLFKPDFSNATGTNSPSVDPKDITPTDPYTVLMFAGGKFETPRTIASVSSTGLTLDFCYSTINYCVTD